MVKKKGRYHQTTTTVQTAKAKEGFKGKNLVERLSSAQRLEQLRKIIVKGAPSEIRGK